MHDKRQAARTVPFGQTSPAINGVGQLCTVQDFCTVQNLRAGLDASASRARGHVALTHKTDDDALRRARDELVELRARVDCRAVLEAAGWGLDAREKQQARDEIPRRPRAHRHRDTWR